MLAAYGAAAGMLYGAITNLWFWPFETSGLSPQISYVPGASWLTEVHHYAAFYVATSVGWDLTRALGNAVLVLVAGRAVLLALRRAARRAAFTAPVSFVPPSADAGPTHRSPRLMDITLLGTGDAAGWPHPFCDCASCAAASRNAEIRSHTAALIDGVLLIDCGPDVSRSAVRLGVRLDRVRYLLVTHDHYDHASGAALLTRRWAGGGPLTVVGPRSALGRLSPWLPPADPEVEFRPAIAGDELILGQYTVRAFAADHDSDGARPLRRGHVDSSAALRNRYGPGFHAHPQARATTCCCSKTVGVIDRSRAPRATTDSRLSRRRSLGCGARRRSTTAAASSRSTSGTAIRHHQCCVRASPRWAASCCRTAR